MARDITMEMEINPVLNSKQFDAELRDLEKKLRSIRSGQHSSTSALGARLIQSLIGSGKATTATQARMVLADMMGGGFTGPQKANLRVAQNVAQRNITQSMAEWSANRAQVKSLSARAAQERAVFTRLSAREWAINNAFHAFEKDPTSEGANSLMSNIVSLRRELLKLYQEYRVNRRQVPPLLRQIAQNTSGLKKEVSDWDLGNKQSTGTSVGTDLAKKLIGGATLATAVTSLLKKGGQAIMNALGRGTQAMRLEAAYGNQVSWGDVRARAGVFNMSTESAVAPSEYAADFRQRMLWGEISEREIIGLSRAGRWGRMVMSGEAARNPEAANQAFEEMVANTDKSKMRSILRQLGLTQELMNYNIQAYDTNTRREYEDRFRIMADTELDVAKMMYDAGNQLEVSLQEVSTALSAFAAETVQLLSPQGRAAYERLKGQSDVYQINRARESSSRLIAQTEAGLGINRGIMSDSFWSMKMPTPTNPLSGNPVTVNVTNNMNVNGNVDMDNIDEITNRMNAATSKAMYDEMVNGMPGMRTGF